MKGPNFTVQNYAQEKNASAELQPIFYIDFVNHICLYVKIQKSETFNKRHFFTLRSDPLEAGHIPCNWAK